MAENGIIKKLAQQANQQLKFQPSEFAKPLPQPSMAQQQQQKYTHSFDNRTTNKGGTQYDGTHTMKFEDVQPQQPIAQQPIAQQPIQQMQPQTNSFIRGIIDYDGITGRNNPLARNVNALADNVMKNTVIPVGNRNHAMKMMDMEYTNGYRNNSIQQQRLDREQREQQQRLDRKQQEQQFYSTQQLQAQQFDRTLDSTNQRYKSENEVARLKQQQDFSSPYNIDMRGKNFDRMYAENYEDDDLIKARNHYMTSGTLPQKETKTFSKAQIDHFNDWAKSQKQPVM